MGDSTVRIMCPKLTCRKLLAVPVSARGKTVRCKGCGTNIKVPAGLGEPAPKAPPESGRGGRAA